MSYSVTDCCVNPSPWKMALCGPHWLGSSLWTSNAGVPSSAGREHSVFLKAGLHEGWVTSSN